MTEADREHRELEWALYTRRREGKPDDAEEDLILDRMELIWRKMDPEERQEANRRAASMNAALSGDNPLIPSEL